MSYQIIVCSFFFITIVAWYTIYFYILHFTFFFNKVSKNIKKKSITQTLKKKVQSNAGFILRTSMRNCEKSDFAHVEKGHFMKTASKHNASKQQNPRKQWIFQEESLHHLRKRLLLFLVLMWKCQRTKFRWQMHFSWIDLFLTFQFLYTIMSE